MAGFLFGVVRLPARLGAFGSRCLRVARALLQRAPTNASIPNAALAPCPTHFKNAINHPIDISRNLKVVNQHSVNHSQ